MIKTWVLVMVITTNGGFNREGTGVVTIDDLPDYHTCTDTAERIGKRLNADGNLKIRYVCTEVEKIR